MCDVHYCTVFPFVVDFPLGWRVIRGGRRRMEVGDESNEQPTNPFSKHKDLFFGSRVYHREAAEPFVQGCKLYENWRKALFNLQIIFRKFASLNAWFGLPICGIPCFQKEIFVNGTWICWLFVRLVTQILFLLSITHNIWLRVPCTVI